MIVRDKIEREAFVRDNISVKIKHIVWMFYVTAKDYVHECIA